MNTQLSRIALFVALLVVSLSLVASAQDKILPEAYSGVAMGTGGSVGGKTISFDFRITQYTTDEEVQKFAQLLKDQGPDVLRRALEKRIRAASTQWVPPAIRSLSRANASKDQTQSSLLLPRATCLLSSCIAVDAPETTLSATFK